MRAERVEEVDVLEAGMAPAGSVGAATDSGAAVRSKGEGLTSPAEDAAESEARVAESMELLASYSTESHPGHQPGRFAGPGHEYDGMEWDGLRWHLKAAPDGNGDGATSTALAKLSEEDRFMVAKFEAEGGLALCLSNAFTVPERLRAKARGLLQETEGEEGQAAEASGQTVRDDMDDEEAYRELQANGFGQVVTMAHEASSVERAVLFFQAADLVEEREAVMRNVWSDVEFHGGDEGNAELVSRLEMQFAEQLIRTTEARQRARKGAPGAAGPSRTTGIGDVPGAAGPSRSTGFGDVPGAATTSSTGARQADAIFELALRDCSGVRDLARSMAPSELNETLLEPKNLGVALDLVGVYLKNYEIDKADLVITRMVPLCRERGGTWLVKGLDKLSAVRMKQFRAYDALVALREIEQVVPFAPEEGWEFHDILYRNLAWCYSALDEAERCLEYTRLSVEVKRKCGIPASWFDIWDLGKGHARIGQKTKQRKEMKVAFDLCVKAGEIHRTAEANDSIMLAKIQSNVGEVAMGIGDSYHMDKIAAKAREWYEQAEAPLRESYALHCAALGPMKPLSGWAAGTVAHCMVRLDRFPEAREYLLMSMKVECSKDSTTPGCVIELLDRVLSVQQELGDLRGISVCCDDLDQSIIGLRDRGWERRERDVFALLLQRVATALLLADSGGGEMVPRALQKLREAEQNLRIHMGTHIHRCEKCGKSYEGASELEAHVLRRHGAPGAGAPAEGIDGLDVAPKQFGPRVEPQELLHQITSSTRLLELSLGSWSEWKSFQALERDDASSAGGSAGVSGRTFLAEVEVPSGKEVQFQVICGGSWKHRLFPANGGEAILGPSGGGHGSNWTLKAPSGPSILQVRLDPTGRRRVEYSLRALSV